MASRPCLVLGSSAAAFLSFFIKDEYGWCAQQSQWHGRPSTQRVDPDILEASRIPLAASFLDHPNFEFMDIVMM